MTATNSQIERLIETLGEKRDDVCSSGISGLARIGTAAIPALMQALTTDNDRVHAAAASALHLIGPDAVPFLVAAMKNDDRRVRWSAAHALAAMPEAREGLPDVVFPSGSKAADFKVTFPANREVKKPLNAAPRARAPIGVKKRVKTSRFSAHWLRLARLERSLG